MFRLISILEYELPQFTSIGPSGEDRMLCAYLIVIQIRVKICFPGGVSVCTNTYLAVKIIPHNFRFISAVCHRLFIPSFIRFNVCPFRGYAFKRNYCFIEQFISRRTMFQTIKKSSSDNKTKKRKPHYDVYEEAGDMIKGTSVAGWHQNPIYRLLLRRHNAYDIVPQRPC